MLMNVILASMLGVISAQNRFYPSYEFYQRLYERAESPCIAGDRIYSGGFALREYTFVFFNKTSRQIIKRVRVDHPFETLNSWKDIAFDGSQEGIGYGAYYAFLRITGRANENPITNGRLSALKARNGSVPEPPGTGIDFSRIYHEDPFQLQLTITYVKSKTDKRVLGHYGVTKCAESKKWFANEGYYKLDIDTGDWIPVYYDPAYTDFYY